MYQYLDKNNYYKPNFSWIECLLNELQNFLDTEKVEVLNRRKQKLENKLRIQHFLDLVFFLSWLVISFKYQKWKYVKLHKWDHSNYLCL